MENRSKVPFFILDTIFIQLPKMGKKNPYNFNDVKKENQPPKSINFVACKLTNMLCPPLIQTWWNYDGDTVLLHCQNVVIHR